MAADANQLQNLCEFLQAGDGHSFRRFIENLNPSSVAEQLRIIKGLLSTQQQT